MPIDEYTLSSFPVYAKSDGQEISTATGFLYRYFDCVYLVSNWHVFSGRRPSDGSALDQHYRVPHNLDITLHYARFQRSLGQQAMFSKRINISLDSGWLQHPVFGQDVDVAVKKLDVRPLYRKQQQNGINLVCINDLRNDEFMLPQVGEDVFIIGFPMKISWAGSLPIWKRGSIATEYSLNYRNKKSFLVDSTTKDGMSGSPVIMRSSSFMRTNGSSQMAGPPSTRFLGIYSGRELRHDDQDTQLGLVWKKEYVIETIVGNKAGDFLVR